MSGASYELPSESSGYGPRRDRPGFGPPERARLNGLQESPSKVREPMHVRMRATYPVLAHNKRQPF